MSKIEQRLQHHTPEVPVTISPSPQSSSTHHAPQAHAPLLLVIDDDANEVRAIATLIAQKGYRVRQTTDPHLAIAALEKLKPDLILLDIDMPDLDGYAVCEQIKANPETKHIPIIFLSNLTDVRAQVLAFEVGGSDYVTKPVQAAAVLARIENQLTRQVLQQRLQAQSLRLHDRNRQLQTEVHERQLLEQRLRSSEQRLRTLFAALTDAILSVDYQAGEITGVDVLPTRASAPDGGVAPWVTAIAEQLWLSSGEVNWAKRIGQVLASQQLYQCDLQLAIDAEMEEVHYWLTISISPLNHQTVIVVIRDISDRKQAEADRRQAEERYHSIVENALEGIYQTTPDGRFISANPALAKIYGYETSLDLIEAVTDIGREVYVDPKRRREFVVALENQEAIAGFESLVYRQDGRPIWISETARAVRDRDHHLLYYEGMVADITERKLAQEALQIQKRRIEQLLLNILPQPIAMRLQAGENLIADQFDEVSVLFADLVGFTQFSAQKRPDELVKVLNAVFSTFDRLTEQFGLEKIKTIGDAYMVVGGLPTPTPNHAEAIAQMALAMQRSLSALNVTAGIEVQARIGIHCGSVVAGIIGISKFSYDLWGDTVNTASRMESSGIPGKIQVSAAFRQSLGDQFIFEERGIIEVKGKGNMQTFWLLGENWLDDTADLIPLNNPELTSSPR